MPTRDGREEDGDHRPAAPRQNHRVVDALQTT